MTDDRSKTLDRIRKLRERKVSRGFTEAEAIQAAEVAAQLMREHGVLDDDLAMQRLESPNRGGARSVRVSLWGAVAYSTNCTATFETDGPSSKIIWIGRDPGPELAVYLHAMLGRAVDRELADFRKGKFYRGRRSAKTKAQAVKEFTHALCERLARRLHAMFAETRSSEARKAAEGARDRMFQNLNTVKPKPVKERFREARDEGWSAGGRVGIHRGMSAEDGPAGSIDAPQLRIEGPR